MSYYDVVPRDYHEGPAGTPGWWQAPVPGWGMNPYRAGPVRVGVGTMEGTGILGDYYKPGSTRNDLVLPRWAPIRGLGQDDYAETTWGHVALAGAAGIGLGLIFGFAWGKKKRTG
jgi:hypothetical protein